MQFRSLAAAGLDRVTPFLRPDPASRLTAPAFRELLAKGEYRPEWTWVAEDDSGEPVAAAVWWGHPGSEVPSDLDGLFAVGESEARVDLAAALLAAAHAAYARAGAASPPHYNVFLPGDWRARPEVVAALDWRLAAARRAGLTSELERLRYEWTPQDGLPAASQRLAFAPEPDDEVFVDLFRRVLTGSLDAVSRAGAERVGAEAQARGDLADLRERMSGERSWWRVARNADGRTVGFGVPARNHLFPVVGYLGVLPEHRGHGYADDILAEITRVLAAEAAPERVRADTDLANTPMAASFERTGYRTFARRLVLSAR